MKRTYILKDHVCAITRQGLRVSIAIACLTAAATGDEDINTLIDGIVSRANAIHSLKLNYSYDVRVSKNADPVHQQHSDLELTVNGSDWIVRFAESRNFLLTRTAATVNYYEASSGEHKQVSRSLHIEAPETLQDLIGQNACYAASRLGSLWFPQQARFIDQHRQQAVIRGHRLVERIPTIELEWPITATDLDEAMIVIPSAIASPRRGYLRICVATELGYALPCIEYVAQDGHVALSQTASHFEASDSQLFFPRQATCTTELDDGQQVSSFIVHRVTHVNQPLPADEFSMKIPAGTRVRDSRPGVPMSVFYLQDQEQFADLNRVLNPAESPSRDSRRVMLLAVNSLCLIIILAIYVVRRCRRQSPS